MQFNYKYITDNENQNNIIDITNINFDQILFNGIGNIGDIGPIGNSGVTGPIGIKGRIGIDGISGSKWFRQNAPPKMPINKYDYWINTSPGASGSDNIYYYNGMDWEFTGETLARGSIFIRLSDIEGIGGIKEKNAIISSNIIDPWKETFVFSDFEFTETNINPNYSKFKISTDAISKFEFPLFTLSKLNYVDSQPPSIYWKSFNPIDHGLIYKSSGDLRLESGNDLKILAGSRSPLASIYSGKIEMKIKSSMIVNTNSEINFRTSGIIEPNISVSLVTDKEFETETSNFIIYSVLSKFPRGLEIGSFDSINTEIIGPEKQFPRINIQTNIQTNISVLNTNSYSTDNLTSNKVVLEDYRNGEQIKGEGAFRTEMVRVKQGTTKIDLGYVKNGFPGATGSYPIRGVNEVNLPISSKKINGIPHSYIDIESISNYKCNGISIITNTVSGTVPNINEFYVQIRSNGEKTISGIWGSDFITTYRFYYRGNEYILNNGMKGIADSFKIAGIIYKDPNYRSDKVIKFKTPVKIFEISYLIDKGKGFFKTADHSGVFDIGKIDIGKKYYK